MRYAETGYNLEIDLSSGSIERVETNIKDTELFLGGLGTNAKIMWDRVPPEVQAFSKDNLFIIGTGFLCGTPAIGCVRTIFTTISPLTDLFAFSMMGGFFAPELKYAGYDKVVVRGKSEKLVYLWINNNKVELRDASHLEGKGTIETAELIKKELNEPTAQVAAIGAAGENRVYFASIEHDRSSASRGGLGAVMGDKKLKAIVVKGTKDINIANPDEFMKLRKEVLDYIDFREENPIPETPPINSRLGIPADIAVHDEEWHALMIGWGTDQVRLRDYWNEDVQRGWTNSMESMWKRLRSCYNCHLRCGANIHSPGKTPYGIKCITKMLWAVAANSDDRPRALDFGLSFTQVSTEYGLDSISAPTVITFALKLLEVGILTEDDLPGIPADTEGRFAYLLDKIVRREGIGDVLADGVYRAARNIGKGAEVYDTNTIKKQEQLHLKMYKFNPIFFLMFAINEKLHITQIEGQFPQHAFSTRETREQFIKDWFQVPDDKFKNYYLEWDMRTNSYPDYPTVDMCCEIVEWQERMHYIDNASGVCTGLSAFNQKPAYHLFNYPKFIEFGIGFAMDTDKLIASADRVRTLIRAINVGRGMRRKDDKPPEDNWQQRFPELEADLLTSYYKLKGWNYDGVPTVETLRALDLDSVAEDFLERGIL